MSECNSTERSSAECNSIESDECNSIEWSSIKKLIVEETKCYTEKSKRLYKNDKKD